MNSIDIIHETKEMGFESFEIIPYLKDNTSTMTNEKSIIPYEYHCLITTHRYSSSHHIGISLQLNDIANGSI